MNKKINLLEVKSALKDSRFRMSLPKNFEKEVLKHAETVEADLITIMNLNRSNLLSGLLSNPEEYLLTNEANIPILILNPRKNISAFSVG